MGWYRGHGQWLPGLSETVARPSSLALALALSLPPHTSLPPSLFGNPQQPTATATHTLFPQPQPQPPCQPPSLAVAAVAAGTTPHRIYDLERQKEFGNLMEHTGTITCLEFYENTHLISAAEDGAIMVYETKNWECQRIMRGHDGAVDGLSIHPTGKLALSVGRDRTLHVWNMIKGRKAYATRLPKSRSPARLVKWVPTGDAYAVALDDNLFIYETASGRLLRKIEIKAQIHSMAFFSDGSKVVSFFLRKRGGPGTDMVGWR